LNREFFNWLGNLCESDHRAFAKHILNHHNEKHFYAYPKAGLSVHLLARPPARPPASLGRPLHPPDKIIFEYIRVYSSIFE
jgi:hypothetical protein